MLTIVLFLLGFAGLVVSLWPYVVPRHATIWNGVVRRRRRLRFVGVGVLIVIPIMHRLPGHAYWVFRGKTRHLDGYGGVAQTVTPQPR